MTDNDKMMPQTHLGHYIGPAPTSAELGLVSTSNPSPQPVPHESNSASTSNGLQE